MEKDLGGEEDDRRGSWREERGVRSEDCPSGWGKRNRKRERKGKREGEGWRRI